MKKVLLLSFGFCIFFFGLLMPTLACSTREECQKQIQEYEQKVKDLGQQKTSLTSQITIMNTKIALTEARIKNTQQLIALTAEEIQSLSVKIDDLNTSLDELTKILLHKIVEVYKQRQVSGYSYILNADNAGDEAVAAKYLQAAKRSDQILAIRIQKSKITFEEQKDLREKKKKELEDLTKELDGQKKELDDQKVQKKSLLDQTSNQQHQYEKLLEQALAEFQAIERATASGLKIGPVKKGDPIAIMGNTGYPYCSTGKHLHFEVRKDGGWTDPNGYLSSGWTNPLEPAVTITQGYGKTPWSWRYSYSGGIHTGLDMISQSSDIIRAPADGTLYSSSQACKSATIKIKYIEHGDGVISYYLHVAS